jgi:hypothetical protein
MTQQAHVRLSGWVHENLAEYAERHQAKGFGYGLADLKAAA